MDTGWPNACSETATVFIHPGSGSPTKNWPWTSFAALAGRLAAESNVQPVFVLGDAEREQGLSERAIASGHRTIQALTIPEVAASLHRGCAYVGNDSGITHLAAALGVATVAIFGPTDPARWAPRGKHVRVLHADSGDLNTLSVETVYGVLHRILETTQ